MIERKERKVTHSIYNPSDTLFRAIQGSVTESLCIGYITAKVEQGESIKRSISEFMKQFSVTCKSESELRAKYYLFLKQKSQNAINL